MDFPLPGKTDLVDLHRAIFFKLGSPSADVLSDFARQFQALADECELWQLRAEELRATHPDYIHEDKGRHQRELRETYSQGKNNNE